MSTNLAVATSEGRKTPRWQPPKMSWWYHAIIDFMIANPQATKKDMAAHFACSEMAISLITTSDIFRAHFAARREEFSHRLDGAIHQKLSSIALKSLGIIEGVLEKKRDQIPLESLISIQEKVLDRLGYGLTEKVASQSPAPSVTVNVNAESKAQTVVVPVSTKDLEAARAALRRSESLKLIEHESTPSEAMRVVTEGEAELVDEGPRPAVGEEGMSDDLPL
jgi:hypothetical protein